MDKYKIDGQKLSFHPDRVANWQRGEQIYPLYVEISPSGACNHRCIFCALDFMGYKQNFLDTKRLRAIITEMSSLGVKSIMFGGEGEPLMHPDIVKIIQHTREMGIDVALTTNGVLLTKDIIEEILPYLSWIKVSLDAATSSTYSKIHRTKAEDYFIVMKNIVIANGIKALERYKC
ncbi:MAG: radical SAM protein, partial [Nanoarchaeota archaeon]|nr:radical SAM protein [Nanoarchaeota archaeon]